MVFLGNRFSLMSEPLDILLEAIRQLKCAGAESPKHKLYISYVMIFSELSRRGNHAQAAGDRC